MKTKSLNKLLTAIVLCTLLLVALPGIGIAAAQDDDTLDIYGNANEDDTIDMRDFTYTARIILWLEDETTLADANFDGDVNVLDMTQIGLIILGRESKLTLVDSADRIVTVNKPVEKIVTDSPATTEGISLLGAWGRVVGRNAYMTNEILFPGITELPVTSSMLDVYYETVFELDPDIFLTAATPAPGLEDVIATLEPEIPVVALNFYEPHTLAKNTRKLRYVLNTEEKGEAYLAWHEGVINDITEKTAGLSEDEKPQVFIKVCGWTPEALSTFTDTMPGMRYQMEIAGGINIADEEEFGELEFVPEVDKEWLIEQNPDIVLAMIWEAYYPGVMGYEVDDTTVAEATREEIMAMDVFAEGKAVEEGKVYLYEDELPVSPRFVVFIAYMAKWFHPELFSDLDPQAIHQEYLTDFMHIDYDLSEHGVFAYPEP
jgi:iron complex transport system substrate-binding protein